MPRLDGTGPNGQGPLTGRKMGNCAPNNNVKTNNSFPRGMGNRNVVGRPNTPRRSTQRGR